jgi:hypothetical protein
MQTVEKFGRSHSFLPRQYWDVAGVAGYPDLAIQLVGSTVPFPGVGPAPAKPSPLS